MAYPGRNNIYDATIRRMVAKALDEQEKAFGLKWGSSDDGELLEYLRREAERLGHTPWPGEIVGGKMIEQRFGSWHEALGQGNLSQPTTPDSYNSFARVIEETERQKTIYRQNKAAKKQKALERMRQKNNDHS